MAADPALAPKPTMIEAPEAFENEISTYRALSPMAISSAILGLLAGLSFVSPLWRVAAVLAVIAGFVADYRIRKLPELLTGRNFAHAGIAMGLMFGISSVAYNYWSSYVLERDSRAFAKAFTETLNESKKTFPPDTADTMWFMLHPEMRAGVTPEEARQQIAKITEGSAKVQQIEVAVKQMARFAGTKNPIEVVAIEDAFFQDRDAYATVLLKVGDGTNHFHDHPKQEMPKSNSKRASMVDEEIIGEGAENALLVLRGVNVGKDFLYFVDQIRYPYMPKSYKAVPQKPKDDGHGHDH